MKNYIEVKPGKELPPSLQTVITFNNDVLSGVGYYNKALGKWFDITGDRIPDPEIWLKPI